jgi:hypothetical protein
MNIYVGHSTDFDFQNELYAPIRQSKLNEQYQFKLPHEKSNKLFDSKNYLKECGLFIAEVTKKSTGLGIEMGWADLLNVPIVCIYKKGEKISKSLQVLTNVFIQYESNEELIKELEKYLKQHFI